MLGLKELTDKWLRCLLSIPKQILASLSQHHQCLLPSPDSSQLFSPCPPPWTSGVFELHCPSPNFFDSYIPSAMVSSSSLSSSPPPMVWFTLLASLQSGPFQMPLPVLSLISTGNLLSRVPGSSLSSFFIHFIREIQSRTTQESRTLHFLTALVTH